jgi:hypothetical protein
VKGDAVTAACVITDEGPERSFKVFDHLKDKVRKIKHGVDTVSPPEIQITPMVERPSQYQLWY